MGNDLRQIDGPLLFDGTMGGDSHCYGPESLEESALRAGPRHHRVAEPDMLDIGGPVVVALVANLAVLDRDLVDFSDPMLAPNSGAQHGFRDERFDFPFLAHDGNLLLVVGGFGEHAEVQHAPCARIEFDDHEGIVQNVRPSAAVAFIEMIDVLSSRSHDANRASAGNQMHEVEKVAALFNEGAPGVDVESVPIAHLGQEGETVLTNGHHANVADGPGGNAFDQPRNGWHIPIFEPDPDQGLGGSGLDHPLAIGDGGA